MKTTFTLMILAITVSACATQRYGRATPVSSAEKAQFACRDVQLQIASTHEFINDVRRQRANTNGAHVLGFLGDFGIGNVMEGDAAELSGQNRLKELHDLKAQKGCY